MSRLVFRPRQPIHSAVMAGLVQPPPGRSTNWAKLLTVSVDCMVKAPDMGDAGGHSDRGWVLSTVGISDPPAMPGTRSGTTA